MPTLKIACKGAATLLHSELTEYQGELKSLSKADYERLKEQLVKYDFSFPIDVWQHEGVNYILDGHQRLRTIKQMEEEGWTIPPLPVNFVDATVESAPRKLLGAASQFGEVQNQGLYEFQSKHDLELDELIAIARFPEINFESYRQEYFQDIDQESENSKIIEGAKELDQSDFENFDHQCPKCGFEFNGKK